MGRAGNDMIRINAVVLTIIACVLAGAGAQSQTAGISVLSSQAGLVSGGALETR